VNGTGFLGKKLSKMKTQLTLEDQKAFALMASQNWGSWPMPQIDIPYTATQVEDGDQTATILKFDYPVTTVDGFAAKKMRVYPISKRKPEGKITTLRS
jgi:hypothetical protein